MPRLTPSPFVLPILAGIFLIGCGPVNDRVAITEERELPAGHQAPPLDKSLRERMLPMVEMSQKMMGLVNL